MKSWRAGKPVSVRVAEVFTVAWLVAALSMALASFLGGCAAYPRTLTPIPLDVSIEPIAVEWDVPAHPNDNKKVTVTVGEMRRALAAAERYEGAVQSQNMAVEQTKVALEGYEMAGHKLEMAKEAGRLNTLLGVLGGFAGGVAAVSILLLVR